MNELSKLHLIYVVTGRMESQRQNTTNSLKAAGVLFDKLFMNDIGSTPGQQLEFKQKTVSKFASSVIQVFDDNPKVRKIYKDLGISKVS